MLAELNLRWGDHGQRAALAADEVRILQPDDLPALADPAETLARLLAGNIYGPPLAARVKGARRPVIVVSDKTRATGVRWLLPRLLEAVRAVADPSADISVLVAYGNHSRHTPQEDADLFGELPDGVRLIHHDSRDDSQLVNVGTLPAGRRLRINRQAAAADALILTGAVTFHYHAGFTGGRKAILPGLASHEDTLANHALTLAGREAADPRPWGPGRLNGNPVAEEMEAAQRLVGPSYLVNTVMAGNEKENEIGAIFVGDPRDEHRAACAEVKARFARRIDAPADLVVASAGGFPKDINLYQAHKALDNAARACRDGGVVVLVAACAEGLGDDSFPRWLAYPDRRAHLAALREAFAVAGQTALAFREKIERLRVILVSELSDERVRQLGLTPAASLADALEQAKDLLGRRPGRAIVLPRGSETLPCSASD